MKTHDFYYDLPEELIAQTPLEKRDTSRLMLLDRTTGQVQHKHFYDILDYLNPGDCLVMNDSRVLPARLLGHRPTGGAVEVLLLRDLGNKCWECLRCASLSAGTFGFGYEQVVQRRLAWVLSRLIIDVPAMPRTPSPEWSLP